jgi:RNA 3'-terminal phosphate cyclase (ATP)
MLTIDGARYSGSGTIVRQAVAMAALTRKPVTITNVRERRPKPGLRLQHASAINAICDLTGGVAEGVAVGSRQIVFRPGAGAERQVYEWDVGSAGSTTMVALAVLPVLVIGPSPVQVTLTGGLFQDSAPSFFHLAIVLLPLLRRMGIHASVEMLRPGYVPRGGGQLRLTVRPSVGPIRPLVLERGGSVEALSGITLASHLDQRKVAQRIADSARAVLEQAGYAPVIEVTTDSSSLQAGAAVALVAHLAGGGILGSDRAGAPGRQSERLGRDAARQLLEDIESGATVDRYAADQIIPFAALAAGESRILIPGITEHVETSVWLAQEFLGAEVSVCGQVMTIRGAGLAPGVSSPSREVQAPSPERRCSLVSCIEHDAAQAG